MIRPTPTEPTSWAAAKLEDISKGLSTTGKKVRTKDALPVGLYPVIDQGTSACAGYLNDESLLVLASPKEPVILFGDHTRIVKFIEYPFIPGADGTKLLQPKAPISPRYFYYLLNAVHIPARGYGRHFGFLSSVDLPLAPELEQQRIADKLDTVLTRVDAVNERLARVAPLLKRFRQSVLAAATSGRLTEDWRIEHAAGDWSPRTVDSLCLHISDGPFGSNLKSDDYTEVGARVVRLENIGHLSFDATKQTFISIEKYETLRKHTLMQGDLLFSSFVDEEVRVCEFPADITEPTINKADCFCVRTNPEQVNRRFLAMRLACKSTYEELKDLVHGATRPRINLRQLRGFEVMLPPPAEQTEIVRCVETLFAFADRLEARLQAAQTAADRLTPALLAKAFRGELVPQDPNDEPASELLKRLAATSAQKPAAKRGRKGSA